MTDISESGNTVFILDDFTEIRIPLKIHLRSSLSSPPQSKDDQIQVIGNLKNISMASSKLLLAAKSLSVDPGAANAKNLLAVAARYGKIQITIGVIPTIYSLCLSFMNRNI